MSNWRWVRHDVVYAVHDMKLAQHGGLSGIRDQNAVLAALGRPEQLDVYGEPAPDAAALAAAYAFGIVRTHGFSDGNKRTAWVAARLLLVDNGYTLRCNAVDAILTVEQVAAGAINEDQLADWFRQQLV